MRTVQPGRTMTRVRTTVAITAAAPALAVAASSSGTTRSKSGESSTTTTAAVKTTSRPAGPAADLSTELTGGQGVNIGEATPPDLARDGYVQREYAASGTATAYTSTGPLTGDGKWTFVADSTAPYRTRVLVRSPENASKFSGTVVVEWLNVSGGVDADPEWSSTSEEIVRSGDAWVGVSAQRIGVEGGPVLTKVENVPGSENQGKGLKAIDPARYGSLQHPGDGYSFDIFTQVARAVRNGAGLNGPKPQRLIAGGESQSAFA